MQILDQFVSGPDTCPYLPDRQATQQCAIAAKLTPDEYEGLMNSGWRKFGQTLFRPVCRTCAECQPLRIPAAEFVPDRSQARCLRKNADLEVRYAPPTADAQRLGLYRSYQATQTVLKGWPDTDRTLGSYRRQFVQNPVPSVEISIWENEVLRAVAITDLTPNTVSGVYHFHDPDCRSRSLGTFAILQTIILAQTLGKRWAYFGFYVAGCPSMAYKTRFHPHEILSVSGVWELEAGIIRPQNTG